MAKKKAMKADKKEGFVGLVLCDGNTGEPFKEQPEPIHINTRYLGRSSREPEDYSPMEVVHGVHESIRHSDFSAYAAFEACFLMMQDKSLEEILEEIAEKYETHLPHVREDIAELIAEWQKGRASFGLISSIDRRILEHIREGIRQSSTKTEGDEDAKK